MSRKRGSQSLRDSCEDIFLSQSQPGPSSQGNVSSQRSTKGSNIRESYGMNSQDMDAQEELQLVGSVVRYLFAADRDKRPIQKSQIIKNILDGKGKTFRTIMEKASRQLSGVFGYELVEIENNKFILVNEIENDQPHLAFDNSNKHVLLYLILVHIFMNGEASKEEMIWNFLRNLGIITEDSYQNEYFGDVRQLVTVDFINERYIEKINIDKRDPSQFEYTWGARAKNELTYRSALEFVAEVYDIPINRWKLQYKAVIEQEKQR